MTSAGKPRLLYKVNKKRRTNAKKVQNKLKDFGHLIKRLDREGNTKWMQNAIKFATNVLKKSGFREDQLEKMMGFKYEDIYKKPATKKAATKKPTTKATTAKKSPAKETEAKKEVKEEKVAKEEAKKPAAKKKEEK